MPPLLNPQPPEPPFTILHGVVGSHAYGTATPDSDYDTMSVAIGEVANYLGIKPPNSALDDIDTQGASRKEQTTPGAHEHVYFEYLKFVGLCVNFNPNVVPLLWAPDSLILHQDPYGLGRDLIAHRRIFSSRRAIQSFTGFAKSQLSKVRAGVEGTGYMGAVRKELRAKYGYDTKYLMHAVRLARMAKEFAESGGDRLQVNRTGIDADELKGIRAGEASLDECCRHIDEQIRIANEYAGRLTARVDLDAVHRLTVRSLRRALSL
jgi:uncharacterized protein